jgi:endonuclease G, mitochondrial
MSSADIRYFMDRIQESEQLDEINWRQSLAAATAAGMMAGAGAMPQNSPTDQVSSLPAATKLIGGTYPVFFDRYSVEKVDDLSEKLNNGDIASIVVKYDRDYELAKKIARNISVLTGKDIQVKHDPQVDTDTVQYNHSGAVAIVNTK